MIRHKKKLAIFHNLPGGGGIRMLNNIVDRYKEVYDITIFVIGDIAPETRQKIKTEYIPAIPWSGFILRNLWIMLKLPHIHKKLANIINGTHDEALVTHDYFTKSPYILRYLTIKKVYLCQEPQREFYESWHIHAPTIKDKIANIFRYQIKIIDRLSARSADVLVCNSMYSKKVIATAYGKVATVVYPGVSEKFFTPNSGIKEKMILCIGGINPIKDQLFLVKSLCSLLTDYKIVLVGRGKAEYANKILSYSGNIKIIENVSDEELKRLYQMALVTCITAHNEPFGLSSIESQACGTPVVAINEGGVKETMLEGKTGYMSGRNESEFRSCVKNAIKNHSKLGVVARKNIINNWTWNITLKRLDNVLK